MQLLCCALCGWSYCYNAANMLLSCDHYDMRKKMHRSGQTTLSDLGPKDSIRGFFVTRGTHVARNSTQRKEILRSILIIFEATLQIEGKVVHLIVSTCHDISEMLSHSTPVQKEIPKYHHLHFLIDHRS